MGNTLEFRTAIQNQLASYCLATSFRSAKSEQSGSWIVYDLEDYTYSENYNQVRLEVNLMRKGDDTSTLETLADSVWNGLDHWDYINGDVAFSCYQNIRNNIYEESGGPKHIRLVFSIRLFK